MQTSYTQDPAVAFPGQPADIGFKDDISTIVEEASGIAPGLVVVRGTDPDRQAALPSAAFTDAEVLGVSLRTHKARSDGAVADNENYEDESRMPVRRRGRVWVVVENAFTAGASIFGRHTAGAGGSVIGRVRVTDNDTNTCSAVAGARLVTSGGAGELGLLELNLP